MVINFSKTFLQVNQCFSFWNQTKINGFWLRTEKIGGSCLSLKSQAKFLRKRKKLYQIRNIFCNPLWSVIADSFDTSLLAPRRTLGLQCIYTAQLNIQIALIYHGLPCTDVTRLLTYCRGEWRIKRQIYRIKVVLTCL